MKRNGKRILTLLMALMLTLTTLGGIVGTASAQEIVATDAYVLKFEGEGSKPYLYGSRYEFKHSYNDPAAGESSVWTYWNCPEIFNLVNTVSGSSIAAYCTDADTSTTGNTSYRRINLEDSTYHEAGAAAKLRSIILNAFPRKSVAEVAAAANAAGFPVAELSQGELISATQQAIWETTHGDKYTVNDHSTGLRGMSAYDEADFVYPESLEATLTGNTEANMESIYNYFLSLEGTDPVNDAVSEYSFENTAYSAVEEADGTYTITVTFDVNTAIDAGDQLTLSATCGDETQSEALKAGANTVTFTGLDDKKAVTLEINGYEQGGDVYLFDAVGERAASQSMVGYDDSMLPVHAEIVLTPDRSLTIHKTTGDDNRTPLANIEFKIYKVGTLADYISGELAIGDIPTGDDLTNYATDDNLVAVLTTDADGLAGFTFGQEDWVYLVVEQGNDVIVEAAAPFFVCVSTIDMETGEADYTVDIYPKNTVITENVIIDKDVTEIGNDSDTFDVGQTHTWIIQSSIPSGMATGLKYDISDKLDYRLTYQGNIVVTVAQDDAPANSENVILTPETDYNVIPGTDVDADGNTIDTFVVSLTSSGMQKAAAAAEADKENTYEVRVYFDAVINVKADLGTKLPNQAHVDYTNNVGLGIGADSDKPEVHTGGLNILKINAQDGKVLSGATFKIARLASEGETADYSFTVDGHTFALVYVSFYANAGLTGDKVTSVTTGTDGTAVMYGLAYGDYYLVETAAPEGFNKLLQPVAVEITATSHITGEEAGSYVTVKNSAEFTLPETGGTGTAVFTVCGIAIIFSAGAMFLLLREKRKSV